MSSTVIVYNLSQNTQAEHLHEIFDYFGAVQDVQLGIDKKTNKNTGMAFVIYHDGGATKACIHMNGGIIDGHTVTVKQVTDKLAALKEAELDMKQINS